MQRNQLPGGGDFFNASLFQGLFIGENLFISTAKNVNRFPNFINF
jgi:hypothetical protein